MPLQPEYVPHSLCRQQLLRRVRRDPPLLNRDVSGAGTTETEVSVCVCAPGCSKGGSSVGKQLNTGVALIIAFFKKKLLD